MIFPVAKFELKYFDVLSFNDDPECHLALCNRDATIPLINTDMSMV